MPAVREPAHRDKEPCFVAFDVLWLNGEDLRPLPLIECKARLKRLLRRRSNHLIAEAMSVDARGKALMAAVAEHDLEGIVAKRKADPYRRGVHWWKIKNRAYSQAVGRHELFNGTVTLRRTAQLTRKDLRLTIS